MDGQKVLDGLEAHEKLQAAEVDSRLEKLASAKPGSLLAAQYLHELESECAVLERLTRVLRNFKYGHSARPVFIAEVAAKEAAYAELRNTPGTIDYDMTHGALNQAMPIHTLGVKPE